MAIKNNNQMNKSKLNWVEIKNKLPKNHDVDDIESPYSLLCIIKR